MSCLYALMFTLLVATTALAQQEPLPAPVDLPQPQPAPAIPGAAYTPPLSTAPPAAGAPVIYEYNHDAAPDQTTFLVGEGFTDKTEAAIWGPDPRNPGGALIKCQTHVFGPSYLAVTIPDSAFDAPYLLWVRNEEGWSRPVRLNVPEVWWCRGPWPGPAGNHVDLFGSGFGTHATAYIALPGKAGRWLTLSAVTPNQATLDLPYEVADGHYQLWLYSGAGGAFAWSNPQTLHVDMMVKKGPEPGKAASGPGGPPSKRVVVSPAAPGKPQPDLQKAVDALAAQGGGPLHLEVGTYPIHGTLKIPANVAVYGVPDAQSVIKILDSEPQDFKFPTSGAWGTGVGGIHTVGDEMEYKLTVPATGKWQVWLRYATDMAPWGQEGVSGKHSVRVDEAAPMPLENLPNTGSFGLFKWSKTAELDLTKGTHRLTWRNDKGGGINPDAFVFALDPTWKPDEKAFPQSSERLIVQQAEEVVRFQAKDGSLPGGAAPAVWLADDGASIHSVAIVGNPQVSTGVLVENERPLAWTHNNSVTDCTVRNIEGHSGSNSGITLVRAEGAWIEGDSLEGKAPLLIQGLRRSELSSNTLIPLRRYGDPALAAILGSQDIIEECLITGNMIASPPGSEAGGPEVMRLLWFSTGHGSITHNLISGNGVANADKAGAMRFGGVGGREQNVGEMILFEGNHRTMFFGQPVTADATSVTLPETVPATPDNRLGSVKRDELAHDDAGNETPYWPPAVDDGSPEPPQGEYYVTIFKGPGQGQTRRVLSREGERLLLASPWRVPPTKDSLIVIGTAFYQNLIVDNYVPDGMTGIQLWISCMENIASGNTISRMRRPAFYLYSNATTLASSMPRTWNRGLSPLFFNTISGNRSDECSAGALVTSGESPGLPVEFPRALGNVLRHNSFLRNRTQGVVITAGKLKEGDTSAAIAGTITEFNTVRDAPVAYQSAEQSDAALFRRNQAYFWYPMNNSTDPYVAFQVDRPGAQVVIEENTVEGKQGELKPKDVIEEIRADK